MRRDPHFGTLEALRGQRAAAAAAGLILGTGTETKTRAQMHDAFAALKTDWELTGGTTWGHASLTSRRDTLVPALELLAEAMRKPSFTASEYEQGVRQQVQGLEQAAEEPGSVAANQLARAQQHFAADDPRYAPTFAESIAETQATRLEDAVAFYRKFWGAEHGDMAIVGDFDVDQVRAAVTRLFGDWKSAQPFVRLSNPLTDVAGAHLSLPLKDKANAVLVASLPLEMSDADADYPALTLATHVLGGGEFGSRLNARIRQKDGLSYGVGAGLDASPFEQFGSIGFEAIFAPQNRARVQAGFDEEVARFVKDGITPAELAEAKQAILAERATARTSDAVVASNWMFKLDQGRTWAWSAEQDARLTALTVDQVNAAIRKWIVPGRINWAVAGTFDDRK
jgi:zinc protease